MDDFEGAVHYLESNHREACLASVELGISLSLGLAFVVLSTKAQRRHLALFLINCFSIACVVGTSTARLRMTSLKIQDRLVGGVGAELARINLACYFFCIWTPLVADATLLFKLETLYPAWTGWKRPAILGTYLLLLTARLCVAAAMIWLGMINYVGPADRGADFWRIHSNVKATVLFISAQFQLATCSFAATVLFRRAYVFSSAVKEKTSAAHQKLRRQLRFFIESTFMTFLPPVVCQVIILVTLLTHSETHAAKRAIGWAMDLNMTLSLIFSILATSWSTIRTPLPSSTTATPEQDEGHPPQSPSKNKSFLASVLERAGILHEPDDSVELLATVPSRPEAEGEAAHSPRDRWLRPS